MKRFLFTVILTVTTLVFSLNARAQLYGSAALVPGGTNNIAANTTNTTPRSCVFDCREYSNIGIMIGTKTIAVNEETSYLYLKFAESHDGTTYETTPKHSLRLTLNSTNEVWVYTNITINSVGYLKLAWEGNNCTNAVTNIYIYEVKKPSRYFRL